MTHKEDGKLPKYFAFPFLIAAKAAVADAPTWTQPRGWWEKEGQLWLTALAQRLEISLDSLPSNPTPDDIDRLAPNIPEGEHHALVSSVLSLCLLPTSSSHSSASAPPLNYSASDRAFLSHTLSLLRISPSHLLSAEDHVAQGLYHELKSAEMTSKSEAARKGQEEGWGGKWGRWAATAGGVVLGGVAIGLTSGLAVPVLLPLLPFLSASSAPVVVGTLFGLTGGGLAGNRVNKRWGGVDKFEFLQIVGGGEKADPDSIVHSKDGAAVEKAQAPSLLATIVIPGILITSEMEAIVSLRRSAELFSSPRRDTFVLNHSPSTMLSTGQALHDWVTNQLLGKLKGEIIKRTALQTVFGVIALPMSIYKTTGMVVDNEWVRGCDRARKAGRLLAEVLKEKVQGERPVVLIGSSLGALVLFEALQALAESSPSGTAPPLVDTAIFVSLPIAPRTSEWKQIRNVVGRRVVNAYCTTDYVLAGVGRLHEVLGGARVTSMAGVAPVDEKKSPGIENVDLSAVVEGHFELNEKIEAVLREVGVND